MKEKKSNKGITLVALIVTIIVMLILVAVSIRIVIQSNLLDSTKNAAQKTKNEMNIESQIENHAMVGNETVKEYINNLITNSEEEEKIYLTVEGKKYATTPGTLLTDFLNENFKLGDTCSMCGTEFNPKSWTIDDTPGEAWIGYGSRCKVMLKIWGEYYYIQSFTDEMRYVDYYKDKETVFYVQCLD